MQPGLSAVVLTAKSTNMKPLSTLVLISLFSLTTLQAQWGWGSKRVEGDGNVTTQRRDLNDFGGIKACCNLVVELTQGEEYSVEVKADANLQEYVSTEVFGGVLEIGYKDNVNLDPSSRIEVYVTLPELELLDASSGAHLVTMGRFKGGRLKLDSSSGSKIEAAFTGNAVRANASSGGRIDLEGDATEIEAEASSGSSVLAESFITKRAEADVSSGAIIKVHASEELRTEASSGGRVRYRGNPSTVDTDTNSGGSVKNG